MSIANQTEAAIHQIALIDDHILLRDSLANTINNFGNFKVSILASNGLEFIEKIYRIPPPKIIILDISMPLMDGFETAKWLQNNNPEIPILILSMHSEELALIKLLQYGIKGFLRKDIAPHDLKFALESTIENGCFFNLPRAWSTSPLLKINEARALRVKPLLGENELIFLKLASSELTYKEIAKRMNVSPRTIDNYRDSLFMKLNVKNRVGLAVIAIRNGLVKF